MFLINIFCVFVLFMILMKYEMNFYLLSFLILKTPGKIFLYLIIFEQHLSTSLFVFFSDLPRIRAGSCHKHPVT